MQHTYEKPGPKRGIALYSYSGEYGVSMNLEDCLKDMYKTKAVIIPSK